MLFDAIAESNKSSNLKSQKVKVKKSYSKGKDYSKVKKRKVMIKPPVIIDRGPIDCLDDLITETTAGFPCKFCEGVKFRKRKEMVNHLQTEHDTELTPQQKDRELAGLFTCDVCHLMVHSKYVLRTHKKAHSKIKQAVCDNYYKYYLK